MAQPAAAIAIKRYGTGRLYRPDAGAYVSLADLAAMVGNDEDFVVREARTGEDITQTMLKQIIRGSGRHD
jgi:polyhydroxyalkanoate synthesis regulator protein